jgi:transposase
VFTDLLPVLKIRRFNEFGIRALTKEEKSHPKFDDKIKERIIKIILRNPMELGLPFRNWSLRKLKAYLLNKKIVHNISIEKLRKILIERGIRYRRRKRKLLSRDPAYQAKKAVINELYKKPNSRVLCFDVKGKTVLKEYGGREWCKRAKLVQLNQQTRGYFYLFACYDIHQHRIYHRYFSNYTSIEFVKFIRWLMRSIEDKVYIVLDNAQQHKSRYARKKLSSIRNLEFVFLPVNAPHLNKMDRKFKDLQKDVIDNSNYNSIRQMKLAITRWIKNFNNGTILVDKSK